MFNRPLFSRKPSVTIQATVFSTIELKYCILTNPHTGEETQPFLCFNAKHGRGRSFRETPEILDFVKRAKREYEAAYGKESTSPVFRCDIFICQDGRLVVNEIEHFEAQIDPNDGALEGFWRPFITRFWVYKILFMLGFDVPEELKMRIH